jgi:exosortase
MNISSTRVLALMAPCVACALLFQQVVADLVRDWAHDDNYSHGFLIVPLAAYLAWERRDRLAAPVSPSLTGLLVVLASLGLFVGGQLGAELFVTRVALVGVIAGAVLFLFGRRHLTALAFPIGLLLLAIPLPAIIFNQIAFPLQLLASRLGVAALSACAVPVLREGNVIVLPHVTLQVAEACSGIRSLMSLLTLGIVYGYFTLRGAWERVALVLCAIPVAILMNALRIAGTGLVAHHYGEAAADGFFHGFSGWLLFVGAMAILVALHQVLRWTARMWRGVGRMAPQEA